MGGHSGLVPPVLISNTEVKQADVSYCTAFDAGTMFSCPPYISLKNLNKPTKALFIR